MTSENINLKRSQKEFYDKCAKSEAMFLINRPHSMGIFWTFLHYFSLRKCVELFGTPLTGKNIANVCCGAGMEAEYLSELRAKVVGFDISRGQIGCFIQRCKDHWLRMDAVIADTEHLPIKDQGFDLTFVYEGLHHLSNPQRGILEMARVSREGIILFEPINALMTRLLIRLQLVEKFEPSGVAPYRFDEKKLRKFLRRLKFTKIVSYRFFYHSPRALNAFGNSKLALVIFKFIFMVLNLLFKQLGNRLIVVAYRKQVPK